VIDTDNRQIRNVVSRFLNKTLDDTCLLNNHSEPTRIVDVLDAECAVAPVSHHCGQVRVEDCVTIDNQHGISADDLSRQGDGMTETKHLLLFDELDT
jgi:hypothetical protein